MEYLLRKTSITSHTTLGHCLGTEEVPAMGLLQMEAFTRLRDVPKAMEGIQEV